MNKIRFKSLSSGSCGNCYFLGSFDDKGNCECAVLIDAGVSPRRLKKELAVDGISPEIISGILVTHDHYDHVRALGSYCKLHRKPVWTTPKLCIALMNKRLTGEYLSSCRRHLASGWNDIDQGRILAKYFTVPHDATQTVGYAIMIDGYKFVIMTDIGRMTREALDLASQADTVVIESNYDPVMLKNGPYPPELQERIRNGSGHLSNQECALAVAEFAHPGLRNVFLCHLSEHNNTPELARDCTRPVLDPAVRLVPLPRECPSVWFNLD